MSLKQLQVKMEVKPSMKKLAICIPTYQNGEYIEDRITEEMKFYIENNISLYIVDSSEDDRTKEVVEKYKADYSNLYYIRFPSDMHSNAKVYQIYQKAGKEIPCDYIWVRSDALWCHERLLKVIMTYLEEDYDFLLTTPAGAVFEKGIYETHDIQGFFEERAWQTCLYGAMIVNVNSILVGADWSYLENRYLVPDRINFSHVCMYFERLKQLKNPHLLVMDLPQFLYCGRKKIFSTWHKEIFDLWLKRWPNAILSLPDSYENKLVAIRNFGINENYYKPAFLRTIKKQGIFTREAFKKYEKEIEAYSGVGSEVFLQVLNEKVTSIEKNDYRSNEYKALKEFVEACERIVIYGCGKRATRYAEYLIAIDEDFDAFVVSTDQEAKSKNHCLSHKVVAADTYDFSDDVGIVLGLNSQYQTEVITRLMEMGIDASRHVFAYPNPVSYIGRIWQVLDARLEFCGKQNQMD